LLKDLQDLLTNKSKYKLKQEELGHQGVPKNGGGNQGEYNEKFVFYKHPSFPKNMFMRETYVTNSYGYDYHLVSVQFVEGREKTITVFEPI